MLRKRVAAVRCCCFVAWRVANLRAACGRAQQRVAARLAGRAAATWRHVSVRAAAAPGSFAWRSVLRTTGALLSRVLSLIQLMDRAAVWVK